MLNAYKNRGNGNLLLTFLSYIYNVSYQHGCSSIEKKTKTNTLKVKYGPIISAMSISTTCAN